MRTTVYIDGFNLYFAMKRLGNKGVYWLDLSLLAQKLARQEDAVCRYFTARIHGKTEKRRRQNAYLEALEATAGVVTVFGSFSKSRTRCGVCDEEYKRYEEKKTDVSLALALAEDAMNDRVDRVIIVSTDTDLSPALLFLKRNFPHIHRSVAFPPTSGGRPNKELRNLCTESDFQMILEPLLASCQLPDKILKPDGYLLERPPEWI